MRSVFGFVPPASGHRTLPQRSKCSVRTRRPNVWMTQDAPAGTPCVIRVIGVGGGGGNAANRMFDAISGVEFWNVNTDLQALSRSKVPNVCDIRDSVTRGLGAGGRPEVGRQAAEESKDAIAATVRGADLVFVTAGLGGGTGSGAAPVVAKMAKEEGCLTVGVVTKPFSFEGRRRMVQAENAVNELRQCVDTLIVVSNDKLLQIVPENAPLQEAFLVADDVLRQDIRSVMRDSGSALLGIGTGSGKKRAEDAAVAALSSPLLDFSVEGARGIVFNITGGTDMTLHEINCAAEVIYEAVDPDANIIFGALVDDTMGEEMSITIVATGFPESGQPIASALGSRTQERKDVKSIPTSSTGKTQSTLPDFLRRHQQ